MSDQYRAMAAIIIYYLCFSTGVGNRQLLVFFKKVAQGVSYWEFMIINSTNISVIYLLATLKCIGEEILLFWFHFLMFSGYK